MRRHPIGEADLIRKIQRWMPPPSSWTGIGIGDDAAAIRPSRGMRLLITTDSLIEQVHFDLTFSTYDQVGKKAIAVNLSDIAAMGGIPRAFLISLALTARQTTQEIASLYRGIRQASRGLDLVGGNISHTPGPFSIGITLLGEAAPKEIVTRGGAQIGDALYVTGTLGDAAAGLEILRLGQNAKGFRSLIQRHCVPTPRIQEGRFLATHAMASAMIDLSDGLSSDLHHLATQSGVGATLDLSKLPTSSALTRYALQAGVDPIQYALDGGEDYELLFSVPQIRQERFERLIQKGMIRATHVGFIVHSRLGITGRTSRGKTIKIRPLGYDHMKIGVAPTMCEEGFSRSEKGKAGGPLLSRC